MYTGFKANVYFVTVIMFQLTSQALTSTMHNVLILVQFVVNQNALIKKF